jgi:hypothetical protein
MSSDVFFILERKSNQSHFEIEPWNSTQSETWSTIFGPYPHRDMGYHIRSNFRKFYIIKTGFTLGELVSLVKVFRLFRLEQIFLVFKVWTQ